MMISATYKLILLVSLHALILLIHSTSAAEPLVFNPYTLDVFNVRAMYFHKSGSSIYAAACPATMNNEYEMNFNAFYSLDGKSLLVRGDLHKTYEDVQKMECEKGFELSIVEHSKTPTSSEIHLLKLGYEVFFVESEYPQDFTTSSYSEFYRISQISESERRRGRTKYFSNIFPPHLYKKSITQAKYSGRDLANEEKMGLMWITKIHFEFNIESWIIKRITHKIHRHADQLRRNVECDNYDLGKEFYRRRKLDDFYSRENQKSVFSGMKLPQSVLPEGDCLLKRRCIEKYNFVPEFSFQSSTKSAVSCTNLTTVPIWYEVSKPLLDRLDKFLTAMAQVTERRIQIISGVYKTLALQTTVENELKEVYLDPDNSRLPVPKVLYKIVRYRSYPCDVKKVLCVYDVLIAIHNEPDFYEDDKLCSEDKCQEWGWGRIQQYYNTATKEWKKSKHIYCCKMNSELKGKIDIVPGRFKYADLDLKNFPYDDDEDTSKHRTEDRQQEFEEMMDKLFPTKGSVDWDSIPFLKFQGKDNEIPRPEKSEETNLTSSIDVSEKQ